MYSPDTLIATPTTMASHYMEAILTERKSGYWPNQQERHEFWTFGLSRNGRHTHHRIAEVLSLDPEEVRRLLILLMVKELVILHTKEGREITMNAQVLSTSFQRIKPHGMEFAGKFYTRLFELADERIRQLEQERVLLNYRGQLSPERVAEIEAELTLYRSIRQLFATTTMKEQCQALLGALSFVVVGVTENRDIRSRLVRMGQNHRDYGVLAEHYPLVGRALLETLQEDFGEDWTKELQSTWKDAFEIVSTIMITAPPRPKEKQDPTAPHTPQ